MKIKKYATGGGALIYTPFIPEQYAGTRSKASSGNDSDEENKIDPFDKELIGLMKDQNLLPSDIKQIFASLTALQRKYQNLSASGLSGSYRSIMPGMLQVQNLVAQAKFNKQQWDKAVAEIEKHDAGAEVAMNSNGQMYVSTEEGIKLINPSEFDSKKHSPISNSQLLNYRERVASFNTFMLNDLTDIIGKSDIEKQMSNIIKNFGTIESAKYQQSTMQDIAKDLNSPDGIYKVKDKYSKADITDFSNLLFMQLPKPAQNLIRANAAIGGYKPEDYIRGIIASQTSEEHDISYDASASKAAGFDTDSKKTSAEQLTQDNYLMQIGTKRLVSTRAMIVPMGAKITDTGGMSAKVYTAGMPVDHSMKGLGMMTLSNFRVESEAAKAGDFSSASFGNRILRPTEYDGIVYDGSSELNIAMLPYKRDTMTGQIVPNLDLFAAYNKIQEILTNDPHISQAELSQKARELGYNLEELGYDYKTNTMTLKDTMPFITFSAYASEDVINIPKTMEPFLEKVPKREGKNIADKYNTLTAYGTLNPSKNDKKINNFRDTDRWDLYKGNVYVPMTNAARALLLSGIGEYVPKSEMTDFAARVTARELEAAQAEIAKEDPNYDVIASLGQFR